MKKYLIFLLAIMIITPSVAFASWWNPFSWGIFHKADSNTQALENRIKELENKLGNAATSTPTATQASPSPKKVENNQTVTSPQPQKKPSIVIPRQLPSPTVKSVVSISTQPAVDYDTLFKEVDSNYLTFRDKVEKEMTNIDGTSKTETAYRNFLDGLRKTLNADMSELSAIWKINPKPADKTSFYASKYDKLLNEYNAQKRIYDSYLDSVEESNVARQAASEAQAIIDKEENLRKVNMKLAELRGYVQQIQLANTNVGIIIPMLPGITDLDGNKIFTPETTPHLNTYYPGEYINGVLSVIYKQITQLTVLQAQYQ